ncbi:S1 family peptidase [Actinacidiphila alni]|uniref:S1 family peptidase n=1 Tax=Actinacidiphila alni TaxID=380248 RepID=UPI001FE9F80A|nr:S1 family peptidase [Actinacidiphila alni]
MLRSLPAVLAALIGLTVSAGGASAAAPTTAVRGGDVIYSDSATCTVGFNVRAGSSLYGLLAGHCVSGHTTWYADAALTVPVGTTSAVSFPTNDFALVRWTSTTVSFPGELDLHDGRSVDITGAAQPVVGRAVCHVGRVSGVHCGTVLALNQTVTYPEGTVSGLFVSNACSESGDAGGPAYSGTLALGLIVGSSGTCATGGRTYYQPVVEALSMYGVSVY